MVAFSVVNGTPHPHPPTHRVPHDEAYLEEALSYAQGVLTDRENLTEMTAAIQRGTAQERRDTFVKQTGCLETTATEGQS